MHIEHFCVWENEWKEKKGMQKRQKKGKTVLSSFARHLIIVSLHELEILTKVGALEVKQFTLHLVRNDQFINILKVS